MVSIFLGNKTIVLLLLPLYLLIYQILNYFFGFHSIYESPDFGFWTPYFSVNSSFSLLLASLVVLSNAIGINYLVNRNHFHERNTYLVALIYVVLMSLFTTSYSLNGVLITHGFLILMIHQLFVSGQKEDVRAPIFNSFLCLGMASTFTPLLIFTVPVFWVPFLISKRISFREILIGFIGYSIPFLYYLTLVYMLGSEHKLNFTARNYGTQSNDFWFVTLTLTIFLILAFIAMLQKGRTAKIQTNKRLRTLTFLVFVFLFCALFQILSFQQLDMLSFVLIPLSMLLIFCFLSYSYGLVISILFYVLFAYSVMKFFVFLPIEHV